MMDRKTAIFRRVANLIWNNECPVCGELIEWDKLLCDDCKEKLPYNDKDICKICGKKECLDHSAIRFDAVYTLMRYEEPIVSAIYDLKNGLILNLAEFSAIEIVKTMKEEGITSEIDLVTAVPMHWLKKEDKNIDQAEVIAKYVAHELEKPLDLTILKKKIGFQVQHRKNTSERKDFAERMFYISPKHPDIRGKTIVLCDDVYTTGATFNKCTELLKELGAAKVIALAIANTERK